MKYPYVPDAELRPYKLIGLLAHSPVSPSSPQVAMSAGAPPLRVFEKIASICCMVSDSMGLSL